MEAKILYIEYKGEGINGIARIGKVTFSKSGKTLHYRGKSFRSLKGMGFKANYIDVETGEKYWISGCRKDGLDRLYPGIVEIDDDVRDEYWIEIRGLPKKKHLATFRSKGKCQ